jgi:hypothetical protein
MNGLIKFYEGKLERKENMLKRLQEKANNMDCELEINETIRLNILQTEVRLLKEIIEDLYNPY